MRKLTTGFIVIVFILALPLLAAASSCCPTEKAKAQGHAEMGKAHNMDLEKMRADHAAHSNHGGLVEIGAVTVDGVKGVAKVKSYDQSAIESMQKMGMDGTHHLMLFFSDEKSGADIVDGKVGFKATGPDGAEIKPMLLMLMGTGFGADIALQEKGDYTFDIRVKLSDGKKRQFKFAFHNH